MWSAVEVGRYRMGRLEQVLVSCPYLDPVGVVKVYMLAVCVVRLWDLHSHICLDGRV